MGFEKYTSSEEVIVLDSVQEQAIENYLTKTGKKSFSDLTEEEKAELRRTLGES